MSYTIPIGPYHPVLEEPYKLSLTCEGETVTAVHIDVGFSFRGIELLAQKRNWVQDITLVERVCGICSNVHAMSLCATAETIAGIKVPDRARYIRTVMAELERLHSHLLWAGIGAEDIGFQTLFMEVYTLRERVMDLLESISGNRVNYAMNCIGGVNRDLGDLDDIASGVKLLREGIERDVVPSFLKSVTAGTRMAGIGVLTKEKAIEWGVVGPIARASGVAIDVRSDFPYAAYEELGFKMITQEGGDVKARVIVRALEMLESVRLIEEALKRLPGGPLRAFEGFPIIPAGEATSRAEAPRGEVIYYISSEGGDIPSRVKIRTPSFVNIPAIEAMCVGQQFADMPLIQASIDPCCSCTDR
jgi:ech hydrogenase subunit E